MSSTGFYANDPVEPGFGDQMDPLGTAAAPSAGAFTQPEAAPAAAVNIGKAKVKKKMSTRKKIAYGAGGFFALFLALVIVLPSEQPKVNASPKPHAPAQASAAPGQMMGADAGGAATVMGGAPAPAPADAAPVAQAAATNVPDQSKVAVVAPADAQLAQAQAPAAAAPAAAPTSAQAPAAATAVVTSAPAPAVAPAPVTAAVQSVPTTAPANSQGKGHTTVKAEASSATPEQLASRVAMLERRLARYERAEAQQRARGAKEAARASIPPGWKVVSDKAALAQPVIEPKKPVVLANDTLRVVGVSTRHGVTSALVDFGGVKSRVSQGDSIPGLGTVQMVAIDAAGNPVVEINGVRYQ